MNEEYKVTGYHGTERKKAEKIIKEQKFIPGEDEDNEDEIVHYEDALEELENVLKYETEEDEKDKEVAKG
jgi:hypothetical protein